MGVKRVFNPVLPGPDIQTRRLRDRGVWQAHAKPSDARAVLETCAIAKLQRLAQRRCIHAFAIIDNGDLAQLPPAPFISGYGCFEAYQLDVLGLGLHGVVDQLCQGIGGIAIAAVTHGFDGQGLRNDIRIFFVIVAHITHSRHPPN